MLKNSLLLIFVQLYFKTSFSLGEEENLCIRIEKYPETVERTVVEPLYYKYYAWCLKVPPRCTKFRTVLKEKKVFETVERNRTIEECCDGYVEIGSTCVPGCTTPTICPNMECTGPKHCFCQPGYTGLFCNTECSKNFWGVNCEQKCMCNETTSLCSPINGSCILKPSILSTQTVPVNQINSTNVSIERNRTKTSKSISNLEDKSFKISKISKEHQFKQNLSELNSTSNIPSKSTNLTFNSEDRSIKTQPNKNVFEPIIIFNNSIPELVNEIGILNEISNVQIFDKPDDNQMNNGIELIKETYSWKVNQENWPSYLWPEFLPSLIVVSSVFFIASLLCLMSRCQVLSNRKTVPDPILEIDSSSSTGHCESKLDEFFCPVFQNTHSLQFLKDVQEMHYDHPKVQKIDLSEPMYAEIR